MEILCVFMKDESVRMYIEICIGTHLFNYTGQPVLLHLLRIIFSGSAAQRGLWPPRFTRFLDQTQRRATVVRTLLDE
jgi:hypothetical protein